MCVCTKTGYQISADFKYSQKCVPHCAIPKKTFVSCLIWAISWSVWMCACILVQVKHTRNPGWPAGMESSHIPMLAPQWLQTCRFDNCNKNVTEFFFFTQSLAKSLVCSLIVGRINIDLNRVKYLLLLYYFNIESFIFLIHHSVFLSFCHTFICWTLRIVLAFSSKWHPLLVNLCKAVEHATGCSFNSLLCNLYRDGHDSIGWHSDDEASLGPKPTIASLSLGDTRVFSLRKQPPPVS